MMWVAVRMISFLIRTGEFEWSFWAYFWAPPQNFILIWQALLPLVTPALTAVPSFQTQFPSLKGGKSTQTAAANELNFHQTDPRQASMAVYGA